MALYESIRDALGEYVPGGGEEISLKIKPSASPSSQPISGTTGGGGRATLAAQGEPGAIAPPVEQQGLQPTGFGPSGASVVPTPQRLGRNPQLVAPQAGTYTDGVFEAELAGARHQTQRAYLDVLQQLGFVDEAGGFVPGLIETEAARRRADLQHNLVVAGEQATGESQRNNTLFSGRRATNLARAERPFATGLARLESDVPLQLGKAYQQASDILAAYGINMQQLIASAAERRAQIERERAHMAALEAAIRAAGAGRGGDGRTMTDTDPVTPPPTDPFWSSDWQFDFLMPGQDPGITYNPERMGE